MDPAARLVVQLAIIPDQLDVVQHLLHRLVFRVQQFLAGGAEVHRVFDD